MPLGIPVDVDLGEVAGVKVGKKAASLINDLSDQSLRGDLESKPGQKREKIAVISSEPLSPETRKRLAQDRLDADNYNAALVDKLYGPIPE